MAVAACGGDSKTTDTDGSTNPPVDTPSGSGTVTITGVVTERRATGTPPPVADATVAAYRNGDDATPVAMTTSNAQGQFTLVIPASGGPLDGYLKTTKTNLKDAYLYPPAPISADVVAPVNMVSQSTWDTLTGLSGVTQQAGKGLIALIVVNGATADSMPVAGAVVTSAPASTVRYNNGLFPNGTNGTADDGLAYLLNATVSESLTVSATKGSTTFATHSLKAWPDQLTTTLITP